MYMRPVFKKKFSFMSFGNIELTAYAVELRTTIMPRRDVIVPMWRNLMGICFRVGVVISAPLWLPIVVFAFIPVKVLYDIAKYLFSDY